uniref:FtsL-like putative cell division protein n=1 Tax=Roseivirga sp. TaxID=1964215 RepID=UPI004047F5BF
MTNPVQVGGIFGLISKLKIFGNLETGLPVKYLPKVAFVVALGIIYVWNSHYAEKANRNMERLETEVEDLRADVTTLEADYMFSSKQSEVARNVEKLGLEESKQPPYKIVIDESEY